MAGIEGHLEVASLFMGAMAPEVRRNWIHMPSELRKHIVPDALFRYPRTEEDQGGEELGEFKTIQPCATWYHSEVRGEAVKARANRIPTEYEAKARQADIRYNGCGAPNLRACRASQCRRAGCGNNVGPIRAVLRTYKLKGYVVGAYGECSDSVHQLVRRLGQAGAAKWKRLLPTASDIGARGRLTWMIRRRVAIANLRAWAYSLLDRLEHVGIGAPGRAARREARRQSHAWESAEEARHQHAAYQQADHSAEGARHPGFYDFTDTGTH